MFGTESNAGPSVPNFTRIKSKHAVAQKTKEEIDLEDDIGDGLEEKCYTLCDTDDLEKLGLRPHPDKIAEASTLSSVVMPKTNYTCKLPSHVLTNGISALQFQAVRMACAKHETWLKDGTRAGFFLGDGPGVGKGRQIGALILENFCRKRTKAVWLSASADLAKDAHRDLTDVGAMRYEAVRLHTLRSHNASADLSNVKSMAEGILFSTYDLLTSGSRKPPARKKAPKKQRETKTAVAAAMAMAAAADLTINGPDAPEPDKPSLLDDGLEMLDEDAAPDEFGPGSRLQQIVDWFGEDYDGLLVFDECHKAKNCVAVEKESAFGKSANSESKTSRAVVELQRRCPRARVLYVSATGATEAENVCYMTRLGLWGPGSHFKDKIDFVKMLRNRGIGAMELVAMELKQQGSYIARSLSYEGVEFKQVHVAISPAFRRIYDDAVDLWGATAAAFKEAKEAGLDFGEGKDAYKCALGQFYGAQLRFFRQLCTAAKVDEVERLAKEQLASGNAVVIGLQSTGEARTKAFVNAAGGEDATFSTFVQPGAEILADVIKHNLPRDSPHKASLIQRAKTMKLTSNPLDDLIHRLGGVDAVAELTGRAQRMVKDSDGVIRYVSRAQDCSLDEVNIVEKNKFQSGEKFVAIISDAASTGISLQADRSAGNSRRRCHITLELAWAADKTVQQLGRTHRSNQVQPPSYLLVATDIAGETRFASAVAKRLEQLGALTHGDRRAVTAADALSSLNLQSRWGSAALRKMYRILTGVEQDFNIPTWVDEEVQAVGTTPTSPFYDVKRSQLLQSFIKDAETALRSVGLLNDVSTKPEVLGDLTMPPAKKKGQSEGGDISKFLNRLLACHVEMQTKVFAYFTLLLEETVRAAKSQGNWNETGIIRPGCSTKLLNKEVVWLNEATGVESAIYEFAMDRGVSWEQASARLQEEKERDPETHSGFYYSENGETGYRQYLLAIECTDKGRRVVKGGRRMVPNSFKIVRPGVGFNTSTVSYKSFKERFSKVKDHQVESTNYMAKRWTEEWKKSVDKRQEKLSLLAGSILPLLPKVDRGLIHKHFNVYSVETDDKTTRVTGVMLARTTLAEVAEAIKQMQPHKPWLNSNAGHMRQEPVRKGATAAATAAAVPPTASTPAPAADGGDGSDADEDMEEDGGDDDDGIDDDDDEDGEGKKKQKKSTRKASSNRRRAGSRRPRVTGDGAHVFTDLGAEDRAKLVSAGLWEADDGDTMALKVATRTPAPGATGRSAGGTARGGPSTQAARGKRSAVGVSPVMMKGALETPMEGGTGRRLHRGSSSKKMEVSKDEYASSDSDEEEEDSAADSPSSSGDDAAGDDAAGKAGGSEAGGAEELEGAGGEPRARRPWPRPRARHSRPRQAHQQPAAAAGRAGTTSQQKAQQQEGRRSASVPDGATGDGNSGDDGGGSSSGDDLPLWVCQGEIAKKAAAAAAARDGDGDSSSTSSWEESDSGRPTLTKAVTKRVAKATAAAKAAAKLTAASGSAVADEKEEEEEVEMSADEDDNWTVDCICGVTHDDGKPMIECEGCQVWQHMKCTRIKKGAEFKCAKCVSAASAAPASGATPLATSAAAMATDQAEQESSPEAVPSASPPPSPDAAPSDADRPSSSEDDSASPSAAPPASPGDKPVAPPPAAPQADVAADEGAWQPVRRRRRAALPLSDEEEGDEPAAAVPVTNADAYSGSSEDMDTEAAPVDASGADRPTAAITAAAASTLIGKRLHSQPPSPADKPVGKRTKAAAPSPLRPAAPPSAVGEQRRLAVKLAATEERLLETQRLAEQAEAKAAAAATAEAAAMAALAAEVAATTRKVTALEAEAVRQVEQANERAEKAEARAAAAARELKARTAATAEPADAETKPRAAALEVALAAKEAELRKAQELADTQARKLASQRESFNGFVKKVKQQTQELATAQATAAENASRVDVAHILIKSMSRDHKQALADASRAMEADKRAAQAAAEKAEADKRAAQAAAETAESDKRTAQAAAEEAEGREAAALRRAEDAEASADARVALAEERALAAEARAAARAAEAEARMSSADTEVLSANQKAAQEAEKAERAAAAAAASEKRRMRAVQQAADQATRQAERRQAREAELAATVREEERLRSSLELADKLKQAAEAAEERAAKAAECQVAELQAGLARAQEVQEAATAELAELLQAAHSTSGTTPTTPTSLDEALREVTQMLAATRAELAEERTARAAAMERYDALLQLSAGRDPTAKSCVLAVDAATQVQPSYGSQDPSSEAESPLATGRGDAQDHHEDCGEDHDMLAGAFSIVDSVMSDGTAVATAAADRDALQRAGSTCAPVGGVTVTADVVPSAAAAADGQQQRIEELQQQHAAEMSAMRSQLEALQAVLRRQTADLLRPASADVADLPRPASADVADLPRPAVADVADLGSPPQVKPSSSGTMGAGAPGALPSARKLTPVGRDGMHTRPSAVSASALLAAAASPPPALECNLRLKFPEPVKGQAGAEDGETPRAMPGSGGKGGGAFSVGGGDGAQCGIGAKDDPLSAEMERRVASPLADIGNISSPILGLTCGSAGDASRCLSDVSPVPMRALAEGDDDEGCSFSLSPPPAMMMECAAAAEAPRLTGASPDLSRESLLAAVQRSRSGMSAKALASVFAATSPSRKTQLASCLQELMGDFEIMRKATGGARAEGVDLADGETMYLMF